MKGLLSDSNFIQDWIQRKLSNWIEGGIKIILGDVAEFADSLYPIFVVVCLIGVYVSMAGDKRKGARMSSLSFLTYLIVKVMSNVYGK